MAQRQRHQLQLRRAEAKCQDTRRAPRRRELDSGERARQPSHRPVAAGQAAPRCPYKIMSHSDDGLGDMLGNADSPLRRAYIQRSVQIEEAMSRCRQIATNIRELIAFIDDLDNARVQLMADVRKEQEDLRYAVHDFRKFMTPLLDGVPGESDRVRVRTTPVTMGPGLHQAEVDVHDGRADASEAELQQPVAESVSKQNADESTHVDGGAHLAHDTSEKAFPNDSLRLATNPEPALTSAASIGSAQPLPRLPQGERLRSSSAEPDAARQLRKNSGIPAVLKPVTNVLKDCNKRSGDDTTATGSELKKTKTQTREFSFTSGRSASAKGDKGKSKATDEECLNQE
ncbi:uncharacterized protein L969DRAFT_93976 [Mixia osmundae IAM 14324]|uniref:Uncharacterized protein n=1 Tax=Mixia osmundae (strain CBS 9802 / IAM 14324 / JCM 22182 / KY 12970) TaxID=764103 RepID=G7E8P8_MIXOS|nr:uncharacterized protein L969DRAFT_93976 [Mixia osmundae IAM 14324]KEI40152.1 hypothetical protein L969DRAFT_93976 [Mixia osmundae IAM 14324]GAA99516.1 hypothetical protein E5Q_06217 [Mixia osmundae IAM 14324]